MRLNLNILVLVCTICLLLATRPGEAKGGRGGSFSSRGSSAKSFGAPKTSYKKLAVVPITSHYAATRHVGHRNDRGDENENNCSWYQKYILGRTNCKKTKWFLRWNSYLKIISFNKSAQTCYYCNIICLYKTHNLLYCKPFIALSCYKEFRTQYHYLMTRATKSQTKFHYKAKNSVIIMALSRSKGEYFILAIILLAVGLVTRGGHARQIGRPSSSVDNRGSALFASHIIKAPKIAQGELLCPEGYKVIHGKCKKVFPSLVRNQVSALQWLI